MIRDFLVDILGGHPGTTLSLLAVAAIFVAHRILGKAVDDVYRWFRQGTRDEKTFLALQTARIDEMKRADEATAIANRAITVANRRHYELLLAHNEIHLLRKEVARLRRAPASTTLGMPECKWL